MSIQPGARARSVTAFVAGFGLLVAVTLIVAGQIPRGASGAGGGPEMRLSIIEPAGVCEGDQCALPTGAPFRLGVEILTGPEAGYVLAQTFVYFGPHVIYSPTDAPIDEILWADCLPATAVRGQAINPDAPEPRPDPSEVVLHGCLTGLFPPLPVSTYVGPYLDIQMQCSPTDTASTIQLLPALDPIAGTSGARFTDPDNNLILPKLNNLTLFCGNPPTPTEGPSATPNLTPATETPTLAATATPTPTETPDVTATPTPTVTPPVTTFPCGDVNGDRLVNSADALWVLWYSADMIPFLPQNGDVNGDLLVNALDAQMIFWIELKLARCDPRRFPGSPPFVGAFEASNLR